MAHEIKNFDYLLGGNAKGLSDNQLKAHFTLYQGYVKKLNEIWDNLGGADRSTANYSYGEYSELRRREPVAFNGTVLHELYFENLGKGGMQPGSETRQLIDTSFGSFDAWVTDAKAVLMSGHGWLITVYDENHKRLINNFIQSEHHVGLLANTRVVLALDAWEHAYFFDYQTKKADYAANVLAGMNWQVVNTRVKAIMPAR